MSKHPVSVALLVLAATAGAQGRPQPVPLPGEPVIPIHSQPADPAGGEYGLWAAGPGYKVAFARDVAFYPVLGKDAPRNLPLRWRTTSATVGGSSLLTAGDEPVARVQPLRYELDHGSVVESYDVRADGVEQSFTLRTRPTAGGDLVIRGAIATELVGTELHGMGEVTFADNEGRATVGYGRAFVIDASGARAEIRTDFAGGSLALTVPAAFLAEARYPVTVDPLLTRKALSTGNSITDLAIATFPNAATANTLVARVRWSSGVDADLFVDVLNADYSAQHAVFTDVTASWSTSACAACSVEAAGAWVLAVQRDMSNISYLRAYLHDQGNTGLNTGTLLFPSQPSGTTRRYPAIGGATGAGGTKALVVFQNDATTVQANTSNSNANAFLVDAVAQTASSFLLPFASSLGNDMDREYPCVSHAADGSGSWVVAWQEKNNTIVNDSWDIVGGRVRNDGTAVGGTQLAASGAFDKIRPRIDGQAGRYLLAYRDSSSPSGTTGKTIYTRRVDWAEAASAPSMLTLLSPVFVQNGYLNDFDIAYDRVTRSHWALTWRSITDGIDITVKAARLGYSGAFVESLTMLTSQVVNPVYPRAAYRQGNPGEFFLAYATNDASFTLYGQVFTFANAAATAYGGSCGGSVVLAQPHAGSEFYDVRVDGIAASQPAVLFLSGAAAGISLASIGMPGCWLNVDASAGAQVNTFSTAGGSAQLQFKLPDAPLVIGDLYTQWAWFAPGANALGVRSSQGVKHSVW